MKFQIRLAVTQAIAVSTMVLLTGCSSLPRFDDLVHRLREGGSRQLAIVDADGHLTGEARAIVEKGIASGGQSAEKHLQIMQAISENPLVVGNSAEILIDGPNAYAAIFEAINAAKHHIHIESFIFEELDFEHKLSNLLTKKAKEGVSIRVLYDSYGSKDTPLEFFASLRANGVQVCEFNPVNPLKARTGWFLNHRDHRKIVVVDGQVAFTGGINFHQVYRTGSAPTLIRRTMPTIGDGWRDTHVKLKGPVVPYFQKLFLASWEKQNCGAIDSTAGMYITRPAAEGNETVTVIGTSPNGMLSRMYLTLLSAITNADKSIYLTAAYFIPDPNTITALTAAAKRGVDVRLLLPGISDSWLAFHGGRSHYSTLLEAGVKIYERPDALLHAKTLVVDGTWSTIGSSNIDWRSFCHNDEVNAVFVGPNFGARMNKVFFDDLSLTKEITLETWKARGPKNRTLEILARQWDYIL